MSPSADEWMRRIKDGQERAWREHGHRTRGELIWMGQHGKLSRPVVEYLIARQNGERP